MDRVGFSLPITWDPRDRFVEPHRRWSNEQQPILRSQGILVATTQIMLYRSIVSMPVDIFVESGSLQPTTESGAFLSAHSSSLSMNTVMFVKCSARSEGALLLSDSADLKLTATDLSTALPAQMEELSSTASQAMERTDSKQSVPLAQENSFSIPTRASIHDHWAGVHHTLIRKLSCRGGASIFFDGSRSDSDRISSSQKELLLRSLCPSLNPFNMICPRPALILCFHSASRCLSSSWTTQTHLSTLHSPHLIDEDGNMLEISANDKIGLKDGSFSLQAEATKMLRTHPSAIRLDGCTFAIDSTSACSRTASQLKRQEVDQPRLRRGQSGAVHIFPSSPASISLNLACLSNCGADTSPNDILIEGLDEQEWRDVLKEGQHVGGRPHFGWSKGVMWEWVGSNSQTWLFPSSSATSSSLSRLDTWPCMLCHAVPLDTPLIQEPVLLIEELADLVDWTRMACWAFWTLKQNGGTLSRSLFLQAQRRLHLIVSSDPTDECPHQIATVAGLLSFSLADRGFAGSPAVRSLRRLHHTSHSPVSENCRVMQLFTVLL
ncbi:hypothetical protein BLNAU_12137 [Blattamonas nauphoetae]|uniref:Uncharacterized protein n=1 Tax=Blattamonas nauphoetae TaxID=2049346 RepID=A0ABQ9XRD5_9EUKA|nr:hypothetical protein BLNAU_12137 [Blattamonas nauphoetae]